MHLGVVVARSAKHIDHLSNRILHGVGPANDLDQHLLTVFGSVQIPQRNEHIVREFAVIDIDECIIVGQLQHAHIFFIGMGHHFDHFAFGVHLPFSRADDDHFDTIPIEDMIVVSTTDINVLLQPLDLYIKSS